MARRTTLHALLVLLVALLSCIGSSVAQSTNNATSIQPSASASSNSSSASNSATPTSNSTASATTTPSATTTIPAASASASASPPPFLATKIEGWSGALGVLFILTGLALVLSGVRSRWTSFFLMGFWSAATVVGMIVLHFGVDQALKPPSQSTRGLFLFASLAAGCLLGGACVIWWTGATYLCGAMGGFSVGMFILALRSDGLIQSVAGKYGLLLGLAALGFAASCFTRLQHGVVLFGTAAIGATTLVLGIDALTSQNLKEFYAYNLGAGLRRLNRFPHTTAIQVELGVMAAVFLCSLLLQWKFMKVLVTRVKDLRQADLERERKEEQQAIRNRLSGAELEQWEEKYGSKRGQKTEVMAAKSAEQLLPELNFSGSKTPATPSAPPLSAKWTNYLSTRKVFVDDRPKRQAAPRAPPRPLSPAELEEGRRSTMDALPLPRPISTSFPSLSSSNQLARPTSPFNSLPSAERTHRPSLPTRLSSGLSRAFATEERSATPPIRHTTANSSEDDIPLSHAMRDRGRYEGAPKPTQSREVPQQRRQSIDALQPTRRDSAGAMLDRVSSPVQDSGRRSSIPLEQPAERVPLAMRRESSRAEGISKVDSWRRNSMMDVAAVEPEASKPKGKNDWLKY